MDVRSEYGSSYINDVVLMMDFDVVLMMYFYVQMKWFFIAEFGRAAKIRKIVVYCFFISLLVPEL